MTTETPLRLVSEEHLRSIGEALLLAYQVPKEYAETTVHALLQANLRGVDSHGISYLPLYLKRIKKKVIDPGARPEVLHRNGAAAVIDGNNGLGAVNGALATDLSREMMKQCGAGLTTVRNSGHFGMTAHYAGLAARDDAIGIAMTNAPSSVAAYGAKEPVLGTNPMSFVFPMKGRAPISIDFATSAIARTKLKQLAEQNKEIPEGLALNQEGYTTTDATEGYEGVLLPAAGVKGYSLALIVEILSGVLANAALTTNVGQLVNDFSRPQNVGHFIGAISINSFLEMEEYEELMEQLLESIKGAQKAPQVDEIYYPGEIEAQTKKERVENGIPLSTKLVDTLNQLLAEEKLENYQIQIE
ncbi:Ldh family oxidoreductase [Salsuginibacillus kocurii]|uniref:Ldh family oxidoreductase n=1 Tax=Salsuginibacillus kocurii TaxID=427078 RepID=UPI000367C70F|nr:Ldh family oxidoreductase [Salsuginibacillus kocurii]